MKFKPAREIAQNVAWRILGIAAERLVDTRPLGRIPGWWSGMALMPPLDATRRLRFRLWERLPGTRVRVPWYDGLRVELTLGNDLSACLYVGGSIDPNEFAFLADSFQQGMTFIDVGANEGLYSLFASRRVKEHGTVIAVEPSEREIAQIQRNITLNEASNIQICSVALSDSDGQSVLQVAEANHAGHNTLSRFVSPYVRGAGEQTVELMRLDSLVARKKLTRVDIIKIDVEGAELDVLRGGEATLRRFRPLLLLELTDETLATNKASADDVIEFVEFLGYDLFEFSQETGTLMPVAGKEPASINVVARPT